MGEVGYKTLAIDIETFSDVDLIKCGVYAYADSPAFEILLLHTALMMKKQRLLIWHRANS